MPRSMTLPIVTGLSILGALSGVALGRSAISEIDPSYFSAAPARFHADRVPNPPDWTQVQLTQYRQEGLEAGLGTGCFGCRAPDAVYAAPAMATYGDSWVAEAEAEAEPADMVVYEEAPDPERERLVRYASYPLTEAEEEARSAEAEPAPDDYAGAGGDTVAMD
jgi:hypothetical protein